MNTNENTNIKKKDIFFTHTKQAIVNSRIYKKYKIIICSLIICTFLILVSAVVYANEYKKGNIYFSESNEQIRLCNKVYEGMQTLNGNYGKFNKDDLLKIINQGRFELLPVYWAEINSASNYDKITPNYITEEKLGLDWGLFYQNFFQNQEFTHYSIELKNSEEQIAFNNPIDDNSIRQYFVFRAASLNHYTVKLYKLENEGMFYDKKKNFKSEEAFHYFTDDEVKLEDAETFFTPLYCGLGAILSNGYSLPDDTYFAMHNYIGENGPVIGWLDFIYFSVVAITSFGFGDIIPVSNIARLFVILESLMGIYLFGLLTSLIWSLISKKINHTESKKNKDFHVYKVTVRIEDDSNKG